MGQSFSYPSVFGLKAFNLTNVTSGAVIDHGSQQVVIAKKTIDIRSSPYLSKFVNASQGPKSS